jgi:DHA3 family tetracycline resistance protein-like MFS transporter
MKGGKFMLLKNPRWVYLFYRGGMALVFSLVFTTSSLYHIQMVHLDPLQLVLVGTALEITHFLCEIPSSPSLSALA